MGPQRSMIPASVEGVGVWEVMMGITFAPGTQHAHSLGIDIRRAKLMLSIIILVVIETSPRHNSMRVRW